MAVTATGLGSAASRHLRCAIYLASTKEEAEASYLIGLAAECAVKKHLVEIGFPLLLKKRKSKKSGLTDRKDPLYIHFPELAAELLAQGNGIVAGRILARVGNPTFMSGWNVRMRYQEQNSTPLIAKRFTMWRSQVDELFAEVGL